MKCRMPDCPGHYEARKVMRRARRQGRTILIDNVPAEVCVVCGDTLFGLETVQRIEKLLESAQPPAHKVSVYEFDQEVPETVERESVL